MGDVLTMATMRFHDEVTSPEDLDGDLFAEEKPGKPEERELQMAKQLIESLSTDFEAERYEDQYREELIAMLERKAEGKEVVAAPSEEPKPTKAPDLMAALEESLSAVRGEEAEADGKGNGAAKKKSSKARSTASKSKSSSRTKSRSSAATKTAAGSNGRKKGSGGRKKAKAGSK
jgi:DNA end-binding protein Ku